MRVEKEYFKNFIGTNYEIGQLIGQWVQNTPKLLKHLAKHCDVYPEIQYQQIKKLLDEFCPGVNEEIQGFSDSTGIPLKQVLFYASTYLERGCSLFALLPNKTKNNHLLMGRTYDFTDQLEEMCFAYTAIPGKYAFIGSTLNLFGRSEGMNEHGLTVAKASNGLPLGHSQVRKKLE